MRIAIVYHSGTGNTKELSEEIHKFLPEAELHRVLDFDLSTIPDYDLLMIGTYTWGNGNIPRRMIPLYEAIEHMEVDNLFTVIFGTGESSYKYFCGAVDSFRNMLYHQTKLIATLKIEQRFQDTDVERIHKLCNLVRNKLTEG